MLTLKTKVIALILILAFLNPAIAETMLVNRANANFLPAPSIVIYSPAPIIYTNTSVPLSVVVRVLDGAPEIIRILYCVDDISNVTLTNWNRSDNVWFDPSKKGSEFFVTSVLENLSEGNHTVKAYSQDAAGKEMSFSVEFTVDTHYRYPEALIVSPQNKTYGSNDVPLIWTCDEKIISANYFLDEPLYGANPFSGNTTLSGLSNGTHTITVYVFTERGQATSQTVYFTVNPEFLDGTGEAEPFPTLLIATVVAVFVAMFTVGLLVYFKKHKERKQS